MDSLDMKWRGKKVYCRLKNSSRAYSGLVLEEDYISITLRDLRGHLVKLNFDEIGLLQEEK